MATEKRLIDAKGVALAIKFTAKQMVGGSDWIKGYKEGLLAAVQVVEDIGEVDAVEVVRCKDCKNWNNACCGLGTGDCHLLERLTFETFFCSYGERRCDNEVD